MPRSLPNIVVTGTPGVGKTSHCEEIARATGLEHVAINRIVREHECHEGWDDEMQSWIVDEDKLLDALEPLADRGGILLDWHACDLFPKRWVDLVVVLRCDSSVLYDRMAARGYAEAKLQENLDAEIMEVLLEEAREAYDEEIVVELRSDKVDDLDENVERVVAWTEAWKKDQARRANDEGLESEESEDSNAMEDHGVNGTADTNG
ncbi:AAA domain-containing protein [Lineolata rhizophorae]|uniref:Adenylate kinase isoenzyme 6 homolog n=1 Tax=Lineolata rhizophorae TaxID=578093 RepID=A0A6A6P090_9PEZI|nr:AAA domain-containing protein [Lineolata rhizophorae]